MRALLPPALALAPGARRLATPPLATRRRATTVAVTATAAVLLTPPPTSAATPPAAKVSGSIRATWIHERGSVAAGGEGFRREVAIRWTPVSVARTVRQAVSWLSARPTRYGSYALDFDWGYVLRANVQIERFTETVRQQCRHGSFAELTTTIASLTGSRVLLKTSDTRLDLPRRRGTLDVRLPNDHVATGEALPNTFLSSGIARLNYTGTVCPESGARRPRRAPPKTSRTSWTWRTSWAPSRSTGSSRTTGTCR